MLEVLTANQNTEIITHIYCTVERPGVIAIQAKDLLDRLKNLPDGQLTIQVTDGYNVTIKSSTARRFKIQGMGGEHFPRIQTDKDSAVTWLVEPGKFGDLLGASLVAASQDHTKPNMHCVFLEANGTSINCLGMDGYRLHMITHPCEATFRALLARPAAEVLKRLCDNEKPAEGEDKPEPIDLAVTPVHVTVYFSWGSYTTVQLEVQFPAYQQFVAHDPPYSFTAPAGEFADAIKAVSVASDELSGAVVLRLESGTVNVTGESANKGDGFDEIPATVLGLDEATIKVCARFMTDAIAPVKKGEVKVKFDMLPSGVSVLRVEPVGYENYVALVSPNHGQ
jgi:DNA polymerase-3 subunit beta